MCVSNARGPIATPWRPETAELVDDPEQVVQANAWRDQAVHLSLPFTEYAAGFDDLMRPLTS